MGIGEDGLESPREMQITLNYREIIALLENLAELLRDGKRDQGFTPYLYEKIASQFYGEKVHVKVAKGDYK